jgi:hypothetical protein
VQPLHDDQRRSLAGHLPCRQCFARGTEIMSALALVALLMLIVLLRLLMRMPDLDDASD